ncbi:ATP-dependent RNA helicase [Candidatus Laterigemmans baculatus]|uniref:ATP-dependent RNA helicase n=1 Tax=Candidatus Laterigemmans baculatus TaxID=2770505 RepID=UPI0013DAD54A|nr:ATP-dependent helicase C-terminal domain-containing protein [Candidatus Laterigemmans baculatus]
MSGALRLPAELASLPISEVAGELIEALRRENRAVLAAPPGAGKTTGVPLALLEAFSGSERVLLLQPRRMAARAVAARLASLLGTNVGERVGYQVRMDRRWGAATKIVVMTYGVLLRRLQSDPLLESFSTVLLDEFHERSLEADLTLGMLTRIRGSLRPELRLVVMSATLDAAPIAAFLDQAPLVESRGRMHPVDIRYAKRSSNDRLEAQVAEVLPRAMAASDGHVLVFLPGVGEIRRTARQISDLACVAGADILELYGDLSPERQDRVLRPSSRRKIVLSTNVAETSVTIDGVTSVIDSGLARVMRMNPAVGLPRLDVEPISRAAAEQRAGRAGRTAPGTCFRLWLQPAHRARPEFDTPEIHRGDLAGAVLQLFGWGETDLQQFPWLTPPREEGLAAARNLLEQLGAIAGGRITGQRITGLGRDMLRIPAHPRLARLVLSGHRRGILRRASIAAAMLAERDPFEDRRGGRLAANDAALLGLPSGNLADRAERIERWIDGAADRTILRPAGQAVRRTAEQLASAVERSWAVEENPESEAATEAVSTGASEAGAGEIGAGSIGAGDGPPGSPSLDPDEIDAALCRSLLDAFPDRLARQRERGGGDRGGPRGIMVGGHGVRLSDPQAAAGSPLFLCLDLLQKGRDADVRLAAPVREEWLEASEEVTSEEGQELGTGPGLREVDEYFFNPTQRRIVGRRRRYWYDLLLAETPTEIVDREQAAELLIREVRLQWERAFPVDDAELMQLVTRSRRVREWLPEQPLPVLDEAALDEIAQQICGNALGIDEVRRGPWLDLAKAHLGYESLRQLDQWAPPRLQVPSGNAIAVEYPLEGPPAMSVRLQELFGWTETPRIAAGRVPVLLRLLAPNHREVQVTSDLASFWRSTYAEVRKELRRRYPKHHWPERPLEATATRSGLGRDAR